MTGRTHDLGAFTALTYIIVSQPLMHIGLATTIVAFSANMIGGLMPDIDQPTADLWHKLPAGTVYSRLFTPLLGGHRFISHSIFGIVLFGFGSKFILNSASHVLLVNMDIVWWSFMIGFLSHLILDTFTKEGVPWLFPIPIKFGIPPIKALRIKTGGMIEKAGVFPLLLIANFYMFYEYHLKILDFIHHYIK